MSNDPSAPPSHTVEAWDASTIEEDRAARQSADPHTMVPPMDGPDRVVLAQPRVLAWVSAVFLLIPLLVVPAIPAAALVALVPLLLVVWLLRSQVALDAVGVHVRGLIRTQVVPWQQVAGFELRFRGRLRSPVLLQRTAGDPVALPTVSRADLAVVAGQAARLGGSRPPAPGDPR